MKVGDLYSHLNGHEFLQVHQPDLLNEVLSVIETIDANRHRTKVSKEKRIRGKKLLSPKNLNKAFKSEFRSHGWYESKVTYWVTRDAKLIRKTLFLTADEQKARIEQEGEVAIRSFNQTDFVKERVAVEVQFGKYAFVAFDLFVKHLAFFVRDQIDVGVEILPTKAMSSQMSSGVAYYERELYNLIREGRGVPTVPLVLIGVEP